MHTLRSLNKPLLILTVVAVTLIAGAVLRAYNAPTSPAVGSVASGPAPAFPVAAIDAPMALR